MFRFLQKNIRKIARVILLCSIVGAYFSSTGLLQVQKEFDTSFEMRDTNNKTFVSLLEAEASQRGYIITGKDQYLAPYYKGIGLIPEYIRMYENLPLDPEQRAFYIRLRPLIDQKITEMATAIEDRRKLGLNAAVVAVQTDRGRVLMDEMRAAFQGERARAEAARESLRSQLILMAQGTVYSVLLGVLGALVLWLGSARRKRRRARLPVKPVPTPVVTREFVEQFRA
jgi:methyl-accepting chemotaxis protein